MRKQFADLVDVEDVPKELRPDEEETKEKFWNNTDAQKLLRSLARLRKGNALVLRHDIMDDLEEAEHYQMPEKKLRDLLTKFCDKSLISKYEDSQFKIPKVDRLIPFMNPVEGDIPEVLGDEQSISSKDDGIPCPQMHNMVSNVSDLSSVGSTESPIILDSSDECSISSVSMTAVGSNERKRLSTTKMVSPEKGIYKRYNANDHSKPEPPGGRALIDLTKASWPSSEHLTNIDDIPEVFESDKSKRKTFIVQQEKKRRV